MTGRVADVVSSIWIGLTPPPASGAGIAGGEAVGVVAASAEDDDSDRSVSTTGVAAARGDALVSSVSIGDGGATPTVAAGTASGTSSAVGPRSAGSGGGWA